eukprot:2832961-Prymnesium_polylepis.1
MASDEPSAPSTSHTRRSPMLTAPSPSSFSSPASNATIDPPGVTPHAVRRKWRSMTTCARDPGCSVA